MTDPELNDFFRALNVAALELLPDGTFMRIGSTPDWINRFCPDLTTQPCILDPSNFFSFLENFLAEARQFWACREKGCIKSGIWIESDDNGTDCLFEATAINTQSKKILLIEQDASTSNDKQSLIQTGRQLALDYHSLDRLKRKLQFARDELEKRVQDRTRELEDANTNLAHELEHRQQLEQERSEIARHLQQSQKMEAIGTLAGGIAHDFNNILSAVIGFTELGLDDAEPGSPQRYNLEQVLNAANRAKELVRQILTFSRQSKDEPKPVECRPIVAEVLKLLRASLPATIDIRQDLQSNAYVFVDPTQLHQVVMNLCTNAGQAMINEGGVLDVALRDHELDIQKISEFPDLTPGRYLLLLVKDTGHGMSQTIVNRIFDPFFTTKEKGEGTGMGLSVVHGIIKTCGGAVGVNSHPERGTEFRVYLPAVTDPDQTESDDPLALPGGSERILFVDDEPLQTELATRLLGRLGYQVTTRTDSHEALQLFSSAADQFDLVITDLTMPKMTGKALAVAMLDIRPDVPIILCSGYSKGITSEEIHALGIRSYLMKPIAMHELARTVRKILDEPK